ncbi:MAG TPA: hypothetical protein VIX37_00570 [Candidatus Sulfotelmatobacter sp.]
MTVSPLAYPNLDSVDRKIPCEKHRSKRPQRLCGQAEVELRQGSGATQKQRDMDKIFTLALAMAVCLGTTAVLANSGRRAARVRMRIRTWPPTEHFGTGFTGKLAAEGGRPPRPLIGRWSTEWDQAAFAAAYGRGYQESLASAAAAGRNRAE